MNVFMNTVSMKSDKLDVVLVLRYANYSGQGHVCPYRIPRASVTVTCEVGISHTFMAPGPCIIYTKAPRMVTRQIINIR